jgi:hypothetical protein
MDRAKWGVPDERMKSHTVHFMRLSWHAMAALQELHAIRVHRPYVLPNGRKPPHLQDGSAPGAGDRDQAGAGRNVQTRQRRAALRGCGSTTISIARKFRGAPRC